MPEATIKDIKNYFGYATLAEFSADWKQLDDKSKEQIKSGFRDGSYDYEL